jgi:hypothetical protein
MIISYKLVFIHVIFIVALQCVISLLELLQVYSLETLVSVCRKNTNTLLSEVLMAGD